MDNNPIEVIDLITNLGTLVDVAVGEALQVHRGWVLDPPVNLAAEHVEALDRHYENTGSLSD